ncbi:type II and III secretion system protein family protein [Rhodovulum sp. YNF3179]|uniref:type II and III secretion system protein family protein n=1 Tax=Rhodovulum sp. YNF3179 TaxID=3425127 RepID=UPI003D3315D4
MKKDLIQNRVGWPARVCEIIGLAMISLVALAAAPAASQVRDIAIDDGEVSSVTLEPGFTLTIQADGIYADVVVGDSAVADVFPLTASSLYIQGKTPGFTNITLYDENSQLIEVIDVRVRLDFQELRDTINAVVPSAEVDVTSVNNSIRLSGRVKDAVDLQRVLDIARQYTGESSTIINAIRLKDPQQVELDVRILEVNRNAGRALGVQLSDNDGSSTGASDFTPFGTFVGELLEISGTQIDFVINALEDKGLARRLANPRLVTTSNVEADFTAGGEVPIDESTTDENGNVATSTGYRDYGVTLNFLPTVLDDGLIRLRVRPEVSDVDTSLSVNGNPAFISRKADTTVSLRDGQSFAIAGLLDTSNERNVAQLPWLGQLPVLGTLFRSTEFQKQETDLVILVTPRLVRPAAPDEPLVSPLDGTRSSNDVELFLLGMLEVDRDMIRAFELGEGVVGPYGHLIDLEFDDGLAVKK